MEWNDFGQPIGKGSVTLSHYIGSAARRHVPITCDNWHKNDWLNMKEALWDEIKVQTYLTEDTFQFWGNPPIFYHLYFLYKMHHKSHMKFGTVLQLYITEYVNFNIKKKLFNSIVVV